MRLFGRTKYRILKAAGLWPPIGVPGGQVLKVCLSGLDDPSADPLQWSSTEPQWNYRTWAVFPSDGSGRYEVDSDSVLDVLRRDCSTDAEFDEITGVLKAQFERTYGRKRD